MVPSYNNFIIYINQKKNNTKVVLTTKKNINTFSIGTIMKYFNLKDSKFIRRTLKGAKIFFNFLKKYFENRFLKGNFWKNKSILFNIAGFNYNLMFLKKNLMFFLDSGINNKLFLLINFKVSFTKTKEKKIKSIKRRLKKKLLLVFLKNNRFL